MDSSIILSPILIDQLVDRVASKVGQIISTNKAEELQEKLHSPEETRKLFNPAISIATLNTYSKQGLLKKHYLGHLTFYKYSEIIEALKTIKRYSRRELSHQS